MSVAAAGRKSAWRVGSWRTPRRRRRRQRPAAGRERDRQVFAELSVDHAGLATDGVGNGKSAGVSGIRLAGIEAGSEIVSWPFAEVVGLGFGMPTRRAEKAQRLEHVRHRLHWVRALVQVIRV